MLLIKYKYIKNNKRLPGYAAGLDAIGGAVAPTVGFVSDMYNNSLYYGDANSLLADAGITQGSTMGTGYEVQKLVDTNQLSKTMNSEGTANTLKGMGSGAVAGAAIGSVAGPIGTLVGGGVGAVAGLVGGLFGSSRRKRKALELARIANQRAVITNEFNRSRAATFGMSQDERANIRKGILGYAEGKDAYTTNGIESTAANSKVAKDESLINLKKETGVLVKDGKRGVDTVLANTQPSDIIIGGNKDFRTGIPLMDEAKPFTLILEKINKIENSKTGGGVYGENTKKVQQLQLNKIKKPVLDTLKDIADQLRFQHELEGYMNIKKYKKGKDCLPGFLSGWEIPSALNALTSAYQIYDASHLKVKKPDTYFRNPYENRALNILSGLDIDEQQYIRLLRDAEARGTQAINLSGAAMPHKYLARVAQTANTQTAIADMMPNIRQQRNALRSQYANALGTFGSSALEALTAASRWDLDYFSKAHAARLGGVLKGLENFMANINQTYANYIKYKQFKEMLALYKLENSTNPTGKNNKNWPTSEEYEAEKKKDLYG